jgi:uncharacterized ferritin-like protein (DUF455 family)
MTDSLQVAALDALMCANPGEKREKTNSLERKFRAGRLDFQARTEAQRVAVPGRPDKPSLVPPLEVPRRRLGSLKGRLALIHAVAHIEFNAINLALDAVYRFAGMPREYYADWLSVAVDEARHFGLMETRLHELSANYGDCDAHNGLWEMALATDHSCLERMALVPRVLEARGLDVTPGMIERVARAGDQETVVALQLILAEEVRHVEIGSRWFRWCCQREKLDPGEVFAELMDRHCRGKLKRPFNYPARRLAGFTEAEMRILESMS